MHEIRMRVADQCSSEDNETCSRCEVVCCLFMLAATAGLFMHMWWELQKPAPEWLLHMGP